MKAVCWYSSVYPNIDIGAGLTVTFVGKFEMKLKENNIIFFLLGFIQIKIKINCFFLSTTINN